MIWASPNGLKSSEATQVGALFSVTPQLDILIAVFTSGFISFLESYVINNYAI